MFLSVVITTISFLLPALFFYSFYRSNSTTPKWNPIPILRNFNFSNWKTPSQLYAILFLASLLIAPLGIFLPFYLRTDGNILVVLGFIVWSYQIIKYLWFQKFEEKKDFSP